MICHTNPCENYHSPASENIPKMLTTSGWFVDQVTDKCGNVPKIIGEISGTPTTHDKK